MVWSRPDGLVLDLVRITESVQVAKPGGKGWHAFRWGGDVSGECLAKKVGMALREFEVRRWVWVEMISIDFCFFELYKVILLYCIIFFWQIS